MDFLDQLADMVGLEPPTPVTNEQRLFENWTSTNTPGKIAKLYNAQYWLKHELSLYYTLAEKAWHMSKPGKANELRQMVPVRELAREMLRYYFQMVTLTSFEGERARDMGKLCDMDKFLDLVMAEPTIKKLIENPNLLI